MFKLAIGNNYIAIAENSTGKPPKRPTAPAEFDRPVSNLLIPGGSMQNKEIERCSARSGPAARAGCRQQAQRLYECLCLVHSEQLAQKIAVLRARHKVGGR